MLSGFPSGSSDEFEFDSVDFRLSLCTNPGPFPVDHNAGPLPSLGVHFEG